MNKKTIITVLLAVVAMAGHGQEKKYRLEGDLGMPDYSGPVYVIDLLTNDTVTSAQVDKGILQPVEGTISDILICRIVARDESFQRYTLYIDEGTTLLDGVDEDGELYQSGTPISNDLNRFNHAITENAKKQIDATTEAVADSLIYDMVSRHADDVLGIKILTGMAVVSLPPDKWIELYGKINPRFMGNARLADYMAETKAKMELCSQTWVGKMFVDFAIEHKGKNYRFSDYVGRGQYVLADFWASWCRPCRKQMPEMIAIYEQYHEKGLTVLGVAVRDQEEKTEQTIRNLGIPYPQIINAQDIPSKLYGIDAIPHTILFAPDGTIIARNIYGEELKAKLKEIFPDNK